MAAAWPLVGRREELEFISGALAPEGRGGLILAGTAGAGKTRLAVEAARLADEAGVTTEWIRATQATTAIPFGALARVIPDVDATPDVDRPGMFRRVTEMLLERGSGRLLLIVDDAHLLDDLSAALLHQVADHESLVILLTLRTGEHAPDAISALWKDDLVPRLEVLPLSEAETSALVREVLGGHVEEAALQAMWASSRGNPLFLREIVLDATDSGRLRQEGDVWRLAGGPPAARLRDLVNQRIGALTEHQRELLELVAISEPTSVGLLGEFETVAPLLGALEQRRLVETFTDKRRVSVRLGHPLYGEVVRAQISPVATRLHLRRLAGAMERAGARRPDDVLRLAIWQVDAGAVTRPDLLVPAAKQLNALYDFGRAEQVARAAADHTTDVDATIVLAMALNAQGRHREADDVLVAASPSAETDEQRARITDVRFYALFNGLGLVDEALAMLDACRAGLVEPVWRDYVDASRCSVIGASGDVTATLAAASPLLERDGVDEEVRLRILPAAGVALVLAGRSAEAIAVADSALEPAMRLAQTLPRGLGWVLSVRLLALVAEGHLDEAEQLLAVLYPVAAEHSADDQRGGICLLHGRIALGRGDNAAAIERLREAEGLLSHRDYDSYLPWCRALLAQALAAEDKVEEADDALAAAVRARGVVRGYDADIDMARAHILAARGKLTEAAGVAMAAAANAQQLGQRFTEGWIRHELVRWELAAQVIARLEALEAEVANPWIHAFATHARASVSGEGAALETAATELEQLGGWRMASEAATEAALAFDREGLRSRAAQARRRAHDLASRCGGVAAETTPLDASLSRREREVASLAARGLTNRQIADELVLSIRTVESHLYQAMGKLGVKTRSKLREALQL